MLKKFTLTMFLIIWTVISVSAAETDPQAIQKKIQEGVDEALALKDKGVSDSDIIDILVTTPDYRFGWARLTKEQMIQLKAKFNDDFIKNYIGVPQYVTIGASAIYLMDANKVVGAAIVRIQLSPRSFYAPLSTFPWSEIPVRKEKVSFDRLWYNISPGEPSAWINKFDLNFGVTAAASTDDKSSDPFILAGISYELHKAALLNFGYAFSTGGSINKTGQFYFGITLDSNILKTAGFIK